MLAPNIPLNSLERDSLKLAFDGACEDLSIGVLSLDQPKRERLAHVLQRLVLQGERDATVLRRRALLHFKNCVDHSGVSKAVGSGNPASIAAL
jgi:hypothetical protein